MKKYLANTSYGKDKQDTQVLQTLRTCLSLTPEKDFYKI